MNAQVRKVAAVTGRPEPSRNLQTALESQLVTLLRGVATDAAEQAYASWQAVPAGEALLLPVGWWYRSLDQDGGVWVRFDIAADNCATWRKARLIRATSRPPPSVDPTRD